MYTTDYNRLKNKARELEIEDFEYICDTAMEQVADEFKATIFTNGEGEIISTDKYPIDAEKANLRHAEIVEQLIKTYNYDTERT